jgi:hypothetical protein
MKHLPAKALKIISISTFFLIFTVFMFQFLEAKGGVVKTSEEIFRKWISSQEIREDVSFKEKTGNIDDEFVEFFVKLMPPDILPQIGFMFPGTLLYSDMSKEDISKIKRDVKTMYGLMEDNIPGFADYLLSNKFAGAGTSFREERDIRERGNAAINRKYRRFMDTLLYNENMQEFDSAMNSIANRFFEYCFYPATFGHFSKIHASEDNRPLLRMMYEIIWYYLARTEWKSWHQNVLDNLKKEYDKGKEIVYIAGGDDIFQLISNGIYRIRNIDPIYPTQTKYYSEAWDFLALGENEGAGINDRIVFNDSLNKSRKITMRRIFYEKQGVLLRTEPINGNRITIPRSVTVWSIEDSKGKQLGTYTLERRFASQDDFKSDPGKALLISFNELYFVMTANEENWGIDPHTFDKDLVINVKQLRKPVDWKTLMNIRKVQESNFPNRFGSSVIND